MLDNAQLACGLLVVVLRDALKYARRMVTARLLPNPRIQRLNYRRPAKLPRQPFA
jgi:hypothetical protein